MANQRDSERDGLDVRRSLSTDEKLDLVLDRFLGNKLRGIVGQIELIAMLDDSLRRLRDEQQETNRKLETIVGEQHRSQVQRDDMEGKIQNLLWRMSWLSVVVSILAIVEIILIVRIFGV